VELELFQKDCEKIVTRSRHD